MKRLLFFCALLLLCACAAQAAEQADVGFVLEMRGSWTTGAPGHPLVIGQSLPASSKIRPSGAPDAAAITIVLLDGKRISCGGQSAAACSEMTLPARLQAESSAWSRMVAMIGAAFKREPTRYQPMISRSSQALTECVVQLRDGSADLSPAFVGFKPSTYEIVLRPLSQPEEKTRLNYALDPAHRMQALPAGIRPGLYKISMPALPGSSDAWCLISDPVHFAGCDASFRQARLIADSWKLPPNHPAVHSFLRAALQVAASEQ